MKTSIKLITLIAMAAWSMMSAATAQPDPVRPVPPGQPGDAPNPPPSGGGARGRSLTPQDTWIYIHSRLEKAGCQRQDLFLPNAVELLYAYSGGTPRVINSLADNCLLAAFARSVNQVDINIVEKVARHLELKETPGIENQVEKIHRDVMRATSSWKEIVNDIRSGAVPEALKRFVEKLEQPDDGWKGEKLYSSAIERGE